MIVTNRKATTTVQTTYSPGSNSQTDAQPPSASKSQDSQPSPKGRRRSFFFGLFSSSTADKPAPHRAMTGSKLTKAQSPPAPSQQPVIRSLSPDLLKDPAFSSDPQSHLFNVGRRSPVYNGDAGVKLQQSQPLVNGQQRQIWRPPLSPTHSPSNSPPSSIPNHSFSSASVSLQTASSSSPSIATPSQKTDNRSQEPIPQPEAHHRLRLLNPDPDEPPAYEETGVARPIEKKAKPSLEVTDESVVTSSALLAASPSSSAPQPHLSIPAVSGQPEESPVDVPSSVSFLKPSAPVVDHHHFIPSQPVHRPPPLMNQHSQPQRQKTLPPSDIDTPANASYQVIPSSSQPHRPPIVLAYHPPQPEAVQSQPSRPIPHSQPPSSSSKGQQASGAHHSKSNGAKTERERRLDLIDELDETNPLGMRFHNGGPYEAIQKVVRSHTTANDNQSRAHVKHKNSSSADAKGPSVVPFGGSLNLVPGQVLPHNFQPYVPPIPQHPRAPQRPPYQHQSHSQHSDHSQQPGHSQMPAHRYMAPLANEFNPYDAHVQSAPRPPRVSSQLHASPAPAQAPIPAVHSKHLSPAQPREQQLHHSPSYEPSDPYYADAMDESDAYGGIMEDSERPPIAPYRNIRNSAPVPSPTSQSTPDLNLQRANTAYTPRDNRMGRHPNNSQPSLIRQERSNGMIRQPMNGTPYDAAARLPNNNGYDYGSGQYPDPRRPYQAPPQQHLAPPQQYQGGPPPPDRHYASSVQQSVASSSSQRNGPQPLHIPRNLVMPTPLQTLPHNTSPPHHVDPRHQMHSSYADSGAGQLRGPLPPSQLYRQPTSGNLPSNAYPAPKLQKSMTQVQQPHGPTSVSFAANYVEPAAMKKPARRVLSKKR